MATEKTPEYPDDVVEILLELPNLPRRRRQCVRKDFDPHFADQGYKLTKTIQSNPPKA